MCGVGDVCGVWWYACLAAAWDNSMALYRNGSNRGFLDAGNWLSNIVEAPVKLSAVKVACFYGEDGDRMNQTVMRCYHRMK